MAQSYNAVAADHDDSLVRHQSAGVGLDTWSIIRGSPGHWELRYPDRSGIGKLHLQG